MRHYRPRWWYPMLLLFAGCASTPQLPQPPAIAKVTVHVHDPAPAWATDPLVKPILAGPTVADHLQREHALDVVVDVANCGRRLLKEIAEGKPVNPQDCAAP